MPPFAYRRPSMGCRVQVFSAEQVSEANTDDYLNVAKQVRVSKRAFSRLRGKIPQRCFTQALTITFTLGRGF
jgi:hypothetical protein